MDLTDLGPAMPLIHGILGSGSQDEVNWTP